MAEEKKQDAKPTEKTKPKKKSGFKLILFMILVGCVIPFGVPTLLVGLGLIPTLVAVFTDTDEKRSGLATIGYLNFAGVLPFWIDLWRHGQSMDVAIRIISDPFSWVIMLGAAGIGHLILFAVPQAVAIGVLAQQQARLRTLREAMEQLENIWGHAVTTNVTIDTLKKG